MELRQPSLTPYRRVLLPWSLLATVTIISMPQGAQTLVINQPRPSPSQLKWSRHRRCFVARRTADNNAADDDGTTTYGGIDTSRFPYGDPTEVDRLFSNLNYAEGGESGGDGGGGLVAGRKEGSLTAATALVTGTTIGAGILALPAVSLPSGTVPSSTALVLCWLYMAATGLLIAEVNLNSIFSSGRPGFSVLSMTRLYLGEAGGLLSGAAYVFIHYALLVAYIAQGGGVLGDVLGLGGGVGDVSAAAGAAGAAGVVTSALSHAGGPVLFTALFGGLLAFGSADLVDTLNNLFVLCVLSSFVLLLGLAAPQVSIDYLTRADWPTVLPAIPTMIVALVFHNVVPVITTQLEGDRAKITKAILLGSAIPLAMFLAWNAVIVGSVPPEALAAYNEAAAAAAAAGEAAPPPFDPLEKLRDGEGGALLSLAVSTFSEFAIVTSFIGFVLGLKDFFQDAFSSSASSTSSSSSSSSSSPPLPAPAAAVVMTSADDSAASAATATATATAIATATATATATTAIAAAPAASPVGSSGAPGDLVVLALVLVPPMLFALVDPDVFFGALDTAGTFGISLLFGLVPAVMAV